MFKEGTNVTAFMSKFILFMSESFCDSIISANEWLKPKIFSYSELSNRIIVKAVVIIFTCYN